MKSRTVNLYILFYGNTLNKSIRKNIKKLKILKKKNSEIITNILLKLFLNKYLYFLYNVPILKR